MPDDPQKFQISASVNATPKMSDDARLYQNCMAEIRDRVNVVRALGEGHVTTGNHVFYSEMALLQLRKILELIAFASLTANREKFAAAHEKFTTMWRAKDMLQDLEKINPYFYPAPMKPPQQQPDGSKHCEGVDGFLTKDDFASLYDVAGDVLHVRNPFSAHDPVIRMRYSTRQWLERIQALLALHVVHLVDGNVWLVQIPEQGPVQMWLAEPHAEKVTGGPEQAEGK